jgi:hypothetical protein
LGIERFKQRDAAYQERRKLVSAAAEERPLTDVTAQNLANALGISEISARDMVGRFRRTGKVNEPNWIPDGIKSTVPILLSEEARQAIDLPPGTRNAVVTKLIMNLAEHLGMQAESTGT